MSYYTKFADVEALLTSSTTSVLASTDALLVFNVASGKMYQTTVGAVSAGAGSASGGAAFQSLTSSTAVNITGFGATNLGVAITGTYILSAAAVPGILKTITSSSTGTITITCSGASLSSTGAINGSTITMTGAAAESVGSITLISVGTTPSTRWNTVAYSPTTVVLA